MQAIFSNYIFQGCLTVILFFLGIVIGRTVFRRKSESDGMIFVEPTEDGERERIRFVLNMDLDEIKQRKQIIFVIMDSESKNSQSL